MKRLILLLTAALFASSLFGQSGNATLTGTVADASSAVIAGAQVVATNNQTGVAKTTKTTASGLYVIPELTPGRYTVEIEAVGFETRRYADVALDVAQQARIDASMQVGSEKQVVSVTSDVAALQTVEASVGTVVNSQSVVSLPLNGRYFTQLLQLSPGTVPAIRDIPSGNNFRNGVQRNGMPAFGVNGQSGAYTNFRLDGIENTEREFGGANIAVSVDAIAEFKLQTANFSAEYGRSPAQVDVVSKGGTNEMHGSLFEFLRNDKFDASQWSFAGPHTPPLLKRNQFGGAIGGPIRKDKLFYFFNYDGTREVFSLPQTTSVIPGAQRNGVFPAGNPIFDPFSGLQFPGNAIPSSRLDPIAAKVLKLVPTPNITGNTDINRAGQPIGESNNFLFVPRHTTQIDQFNVRGDYAYSAKDTFSARYTFSTNHQVGDGPLATNIQGSLVGADVADIGGQNLSGTWYHNFGPATINEVRAGFLLNPQNYAKSDNTDYAAQFGLSSALASNAYKGLPHFNIGAIVLSSGDARPLISGDTNREIVDNLTLIRGGHNLRMGASIRLTTLTTTNSNFSTGTFSFNGVQTRDRRTVSINGTNTNLGATGTSNCPGGSDPTACPAGSAYADFLLGYLSSFSTNTLVPLTTKFTYAWAGYIQDSWRVNRQLTLTLGLRYDFYRRPVSDPHSYAQPEIQNGQFTGRLGVAEDNGNLSSRALPQALALTPGAFVGCSKLGLPADNCLRSEKNDFQPRVGFTWQTDENTVIRGAIGTFVGRWGGNQETEVGTNNYPATLPVATPTYTAAPAGSAPPPLLLSNPTAALAAAAPNLSGHDPDRRLPQTYQWNLTIERLLPGSVTTSLGYVSVLGRHIADGGVCCVYNSLDPTGVVLAPGQTQKRVDPRFSQVTVTRSENTSAYQSLQAQAAKRFSNGFTFTGAYTWSKNTGVTVGLSDPRFPAIDRGPLQTDLRHNTVLSSVWVLPFGRGQRFLNVKGFVNQVVGGWQLNQITSFRSGFPFTPTLAGTDLLNARGVGKGADRPDSICNGKLNNPTVFNWFDKSCFRLPVESTVPGALLRQGNSGSNILYGPGGFNLDLGVAKQISLSERKALDFRAEAFNVLNHPTFNLPDSNISPSGANTPARITSTVSSPRTLQLALKLRF